MARPRKDGTTAQDDPLTTHSHISYYAELAEEEDDGISVCFDNDAYPSPEHCRKALIRFRNSFSALKARERREATRLGLFTARFEDLGCFIEKTEFGWVAIIENNAQTPSRVVKRNGEPLRQLSPEYKRFKYLQEEGTMSNSTSCPFPQEDIDFLWSYDPELTRLLYESRKWPLPIEKGN